MSTVLRLEKDGKKYWIASVDGKTAIVTFGKIGKEDKEESKKFEHASEELSSKEIVDIKMLRFLSKKRKIKKGKDTAMARKVVRIGLNLMRKLMQMK